MVALIGLERNLLDRSELLLSQRLDLLSVHLLWGLGRVDAGSLDRNDEGTSVLDKHACVQAENTRLIRLSDISKDNVDHGHQHAILLGVASVLDDRDHVGALLGHVHEVAA